MPGANLLFVAVSIASTCRQTADLDHGTAGSRPLFPNETRVTVRLERKWKNSSSVHVSNVLRLADGAQVRHFGSIESR